MSDKRIKFTPHSEETILRILEMHDAGMRSKDIYKQSKGVFGFCIKQSTISNILKRNGRNAKDNTYRIKRGASKRKPETIHDFPTLRKYTQTPENTYVPKIENEGLIEEKSGVPEGVAGQPEDNISEENNDSPNNDYIPRNSELSVDKLDSDFENPQNDEDFEPEDDEEYEDSEESE
jgi:hypothetical protein